MTEDLSLTGQLASTTNIYHQTSRDNSPLCRNPNVFIQVCLLETIVDIVAFNVRQRKLVNVDSDIKLLVSSTPCEADKDDARVSGAMSEDLRFETIEEGGHENVKSDSYNRNTYAVSESAINSPASSLLKTIDTLIKEKFEKLGTTMDHLLRELSFGSRSEIKDGRETPDSQETKGV
ncbi:hypothetical protein CHS0354_039341 [Potamilus streckersoni]|uniref:Uncharacterized protein n=1 Tax=Potamilus streckersoni TaxID=2493646 RepID=A0AAE0W5L2_9BIVA|nr:hypothetical protein CHS0354_039341 [Potamilus streckersoni]